MADMEHAPWIGDDYWDQPKEQRFLIAGFSHHDRYDPGKENEARIEAADDPDFTCNVFRRWVFTGELPFFNVIPSYFGEGLESFWNKAAFANTLPTTVGDAEEKFSDGTPEQRAAAGPRALRLVETLRPARVFVFTTKGWRDLWPHYTGHVPGRSLKVDGAGEVDYGSYRHADGDALAFGFRHPLFAPTSRMTAQVQAALNFQPA